MAKIIRYTAANGKHSGWVHWCPACNEPHQFTTEGVNESGAHWLRVGDEIKPTFTPSMNICINPPEHPHYQKQAATSRCHYFLRNGVIEYLMDCTHVLKGQKVPLPDMPADYM